MKRLSEEEFSNMAIYPESRPPLSPSVKKNTEIDENEESQAASLIQGYFDGQGKEGQGF